jgi:hypothetical protein
MCCWLKCEHDYVTTSSVNILIDRAQLWKKNYLEFLIALWQKKLLKF